MMNEETLVFINLGILFVVTGFLLAFLRAQKYWRDRFGPDPLQPEIKYSDIQHHKFSLRRDR